MAQRKSVTLLTVGTLETDYGIPRRTTIGAIRSGALPAAKMPGETGAYLIQPRDFQRWQERRTAEAARRAAAKTEAQGA